MDSGRTFQGEALALLGRLKAKKEGIEDECKRRLEEVDAEIRAVSTTLRLLGESISVNHATSLDRKAAEIPVSELAGKSARVALIEIAKQNGGQVRIVEAKALLIAAGILRPSKNIWGAIYTTLKRSAEFEKVAGEAGTFKLLQEPRWASMPLPRGAKKDFLAHYILECGPQTRKDLLENAGLKPGTVATCLNDKTRFRQLGDGRWDVIKTGD